jgi:hypothetical protein
VLVVGKVASESASLWGAVLWFRSEKSHGTLLLSMCIGWPARPDIPAYVAAGGASVRAS